MDFGAQLLLLMSQVGFCTCGVRERNGLFMTSPGKLVTQGSALKLTGKFPRLM